MNAPVTYGTPLPVSPLDGEPAVGQGAAIYSQAYGHATSVESPPIQFPAPLDTATPLSSDTTLRSSNATGFMSGFGSSRLGHSLSVV